MTTKTMTVEYFDIPFTVTFDYDENSISPVTAVDIRTEANLTELFFCCDNGRRLSAIEELVEKAVRGE